ncbi:MAG: NAD(P)-dependent oxidoreductase [Candidatus Caldarchaeum sp.]
MGGVLVTGGCGFLGSWIARTLVSEDYEVVLFDVNETPLIKDIRNKLDFQKGSITDYVRVEEVIKKSRPNTIFHLAALLSAAAEQNPKTGYEVNIATTWPFFELSLKYDVENVLFASSIAVYSSGRGKTVNESMYTTPSTVYGVSKIFGELVGFWFYKRYGLRFAALRYASIIGPGRRNGGASAYSSLVIQKAAQQEPYVVPVPEDAVIPLVYVKDAVDATLHVWREIKRLNERVLNVAGLQPSPTALELVNAVKKQLPEADVSFSPAANYTEIVRAWPGDVDTSRIAALGWKPTYSNLDLAVQDFIREVRENRSVFWI